MQRHYAAIETDEDQCLFSSALNVVDQAIMIIDNTRCLVFVNDAYRQILSLPPYVTARGTPIERVFSYLRDRGEYGNDFDGNHVASWMTAVIDRVRFRLDRKRPNGMYIEAFGSPVNDGGYVFTVTDVTERKQMLLDLEALVQERTAELRQANDELTHLASLDPLLGIMNRRAFLQVAEDQGRRMASEAKEVSLLMLDLDWFKTINDRFGHAAGDAMLSATVAAILPCLRDCDRLARYGGEEFVVILPDCPLLEAERTAERIRTAIRETAVDIAKEPLRITASIGVARWRPGEPTVAMAIARADMAVYAAKHAGRDRVVVSA